MKKIREYNGRTGRVYVFEYSENASLEYRVVSENKFISGYWTRDKVEAIKYAQFIAANY